jgi:putative ABC transport system substrate-binding protein
MLRLLALAILVGVLAQPATAQQPVPGKTYKIGFSQIVDHPALNATRQGFIDELAAAGFVVGRNLVLDYQNAQGDVGNARNIAQKFLTESVDLLAPCTTPNVMATIQLAKGGKTPVVFGCVTNPVEAGVVPAVDKPTGTNVTGYYSIPPVGRSLELFLQIKPGMKTVGTLYNASETNSINLKRIAKAEAEKRGLTWVEATVASSAEVKTAIDTLVTKVDAVLTAQDNTVSSAYEAVVKATRDAKKPLFALDVSVVERGAIAAMAQNQYEAGKGWAKELAIPVLLGKDPGTLKPVEASVYDLQVNLAAAKEAGVTVPEAAVARAVKVFGR